MTLYEKLFDYQRSAVDFCMRNVNSALFFEQGTGKTWVTMGVIEEVLDSVNPQVLIVVPLANMETTWLKLLDEHFPKAPITVLHYEAVPKLIRKLRRKHWGLIVYDESQRLKARGSLASRTAAKLADSADRKLILSGTPIEQAPQDLWAQFRFLDQRCFGKRWRDFEDEYLVRTGFMGYKRKFIRTKMAQFLQQIEPFTLRVKKADVLDLPAIHFKKVGVELLGKQRVIYEELESEMATTVQGTSIEADLAITQLVRLQQVCGGFIKSESEILVVGKAKIRRVRRLVAESTKPVVIFCKYLEELEQLQNALGYLRVATISGRNRKTRSATIKAFQSDEIDVLICQVRSGGVGIDLFKARTVIFYSMTYSFIDYEQALARAHRIGQIHELMVYILFAKSTVDEDIFMSILDKRSVSEAILARLSKKE